MQDGTSTAQTAGDNDMGRDKGMMAPTGDRKDTKGGEEKEREGDGIGTTGISNQDRIQDKEVGEERGGKRTTGRCGRRRTGNRRGDQGKIGRRGSETAMGRVEATAGIRGMLGTGSRMNTTDIRGMPGTGSLRGRTTAEVRGVTKKGSRAGTTDIRGMAEKRNHRGNA